MEPYVDGHDVYEHYKGGRYRVLFVVRNSTNGQDVGRLMVVYVSLTKGNIYVRDQAQFHETVMVRDAADPLLVVQVPRFRKV